MISVVIPLLNEALALEELYQQLLKVEPECGEPLQIVFVDDGSSDGSWQVISRLASEDSRVLGIRFRRNFGKAAALSAGFDAAEGNVIVTLDADLQDDPAEIPKFIQLIHEGNDVVSGWKQPRYDPWHKVLPSLVFNFLVSHITGVHLHDHNCGLKAYRRDVVHEIRLYGELHRYIPVLAAARGFKVTEAIVKHRPRKFGSSKYGVGRFLKGFLDLLTVKFITGYGDRPQHLLGGVGLVSFLLGGLSLTWLAVRWCLSRWVDWWGPPIHLHQMASLYYSLVLCLVGAQFLAVGLLGEMIAAFLARDFDTYSIAEHTEPVEQGAIEGEASRSRAQ